MTQFTKLSLVVLGLSLGAASTVRAQSLEELAAKSQKAATVLAEIATAPDKTIPTSLLTKATCIATVPDVVRVGFIFGGKFGRGLVSCRTSTGWSKLSFLEVIGGSWGFEFGVESVDTVLVFVNENAVERLSENNFTLGGNASVAAGPVGRDLQAGINYQLSSEILSYSRAKGIFAGVALEGTSVSVDKKSNEKVYEKEMSAMELLTSSGQTAPGAVVPYISALGVYAP